MIAPGPAFAQFTPQSAWKRFAPTIDTPWDLTKAGHLYRRAAFGANWRQLLDAVGSSAGDLVDGLLSRDEGDPAQRAFEARYASLQSGALRSVDGIEARALWFHRILHSPQPARERMTLFWHNHFATSNAKVRNPRLMMGQLETLRTHALGHFGTLLHEMTRDPAMLVWLDSSTNRKGSPNENYAREVMELFSLGVGNYTERDVQEAARALTGWDVRNEQAIFTPEHHDEGVKTILGQTGRWTAGDVVRICLGQSACARFLVRKLFREFVSETAVPSDALLEPLADGFRARDYDIAWALGTILKSDLFYSDAAIRQKVKSPCDFLAGTVRALEGSPPPIAVAESCERLGQNLLSPPSVKGWDGGPGWLNSSTLLLRQNLALEMTRGAGPAARSDPAALLGRYGISGTPAIVEFFLQLFHQRIDPTVRDTLVARLEMERSAQRNAAYGDSSDAVTARSAAHLILTMPEYQLA